MYRDTDLKGPQTEPKYFGSLNNNNHVVVNMPKTFNTFKT